MSAVGTAPPAVEQVAQAAEVVEEETVTAFTLGPRWVRDRNTGQQYVEKNRPRAEMLERRGEVTHVLREQGKRFFTRHKDGTMQMDPKRAPVVETAAVEVPAEAPAATVVAPVAVAA